MSIGLVGQKCGMTRVFLETGESVPVTAVKVLRNLVAQVKLQDRDGYRAVQISLGKKKLSKLKKPIAGIYKKAQIEAGCSLMEFRITDNECLDVKPGDEFSVDLFCEGQKVDVSASSRGKGFAGVVKRHHFKTQDATHGNSLSHRAPGSIGQCQNMSHVVKGKKMAGHMGNKKCTVQNQEIVKIDMDRRLILIKGGIPGAPGGWVLIKQAVKMPQEDK